MFKVRIEVRVYWIRVGSNFLENFFYKRQKKTQRQRQTQRRRTWHMAAEIDVHTSQGLPRIASHSRN